jgi:hypothetical protein
LTRDFELLLDYYTEGPFPADRITRIAPSLCLASVRLPVDQQNLASAIVRQARREFQLATAK